MIIKQPMNSWFLSLVSFLFLALLYDTPSSLLCYSSSRNFSCDSSFDVVPLSIVLLVHDIWWLGESHNGHTLGVELKLETCCSIDASWWSLSLHYQDPIDD